MASTLEGGVGVVSDTGEMTFCWTALGGTWKFADADGRLVSVHIAKSDALLASLCGQSGALSD